MLYVQNGATDAKLRCDEHSQIIRISGKKSTVSDPDLDPAGVDPEVRRSYCSPEVSGDGGGGRSSP